MAEDAKSTKTAATSAPVAPPGKRYSLRQEGEEPEAPPEGDGSFKEFVWNSYRKEFLGRTWRSWLDITIFYIIFFLSLYCFFMVSWYISLLAINETEPYMQSQYPAILYEKGPGLTMRPIPDRDSNGGSTLILYSPITHAGNKFWVKQLKDWMKGIPELPNTVNKLPENNVIDCTSTTDFLKPTKNRYKSCYIEKTDYGLCSGEDTTDPNFGYSTGAPCILLKLNRIFNWKPTKYEYKDPTEVEKIMWAKVGGLPNADKKIFIWCRGEHEHDRANLGPIRYYPGPWIDFKYYPFRNQRNYQSPFVMMKLERVVPGALISIECQAFAGNLKPNKATGTGYLRFQITVV